MKPQFWGMYENFFHSIFQYSRKKFSLSSHPSKLVSTKVHFEVCEFRGSVSIAPHIKQYFHYISISCKIDLKYLSNQRTLDILPNSLFILSEVITTHHQNIKHQEWTISSGLENFGFANLPAVLQELLILVDIYIMEWPGPKEFIKIM